MQLDEATGRSAPLYGNLPYQPSTTLKRVVSWAGACGDELLHPVPDFLIQLIKLVFPVVWLGNQRVYLISQKQVGNQSPLQPKLTMLFLVVRPKIATTAFLPELRYRLH